LIGDGRILAMCWVIAGGGNAFLGEKINHNRSVRSLVMRPFALHRASSRSKRGCIGRDIKEIAQA
jgi:hypothetical protein